MKYASAPALKYIYMYTKNSQFYSFYCLLARLLENNEKQKPT